MQQNIGLLHRGSIDPESLRLNRSRLGWRHGRARRTATLR
jgi:hypothetical protein